MQLPGAGILQSMIKNPTYRNLVTVVAYTVAYFLLGSLTSSLSPTVVSDVILSGIVMSWAPLASWLAYHYTTPTADRQPIGKDLKRHLLIATATAAALHIGLSAATTAALGSSSGLLIELVLLANIILPFVVFWVVLKRLSPYAVKPAQVGGLIKNMLATYLNLITVFLVVMSIFIFVATSLNPGPGAIAGIVLLTMVPISAVLLVIKTIEFFVRAYKRRNNARMYMLNTILGIICLALALAAIVFTLFAYTPRQ